MSNWRSARSSSTGRCSTTWPWDARNGRPPRGRGGRAVRRGARRTRLPGRTPARGRSRSTTTGEAEAELVEQQQPGMAGESPGDGEHLLLAAQGGARAPRPDVAQRREVPVGHLGVELLASVAETEVLGDGEAEEQPAALRYVDDSEAGPAARRPARQVLARQQDPPPSGARSRTRHAASSSSRRRWPRGGPRPRRGGPSGRDRARRRRR